MHEPHNSMPTNPLLADPMCWDGHVEKVGTGTEDIADKCRRCGLRTPEFILEENFRVASRRANRPREGSCAYCRQTLGDKGGSIGKPRDKRPPAAQDNRRPAERGRHMAQGGGQHAGCDRHGRGR